MNEMPDPVPSEGGALMPPNDSLPPGNSPKASHPSASPPSDGRAGHERTGHRRPSRDGAKPSIANEEDCLAALSRLPALNLAGMIDVRQANAYRGIYATILQHWQRRQASPTAALDHPGLMDLLRLDPALANLLEPLLSREQIDRLMAQARNEEPQTD